MLTRLTWGASAAPTSLTGTAPVPPAPSPPHAPASVDDDALLTLRAFVVLATSFVVALITGLAGGFTAAYAADQSQSAIGVIAGLAVFLPTFFATTAGVNALISQQQH